MIRHIDEHAQLTDEISLDAFGAAVPHAVVKAVVADLGVAEHRRRKLPAEVALLLSMAMHLFIQDSLTQVLIKLLKGLRFIWPAVRWAIERGAHVINYSGGYTPVIYHPVLGQIVQVAPPWVWPAELLSEEDEFKRAMDNGIVAVVSAGNEGGIGEEGTLSMPVTCPAGISVGSRKFSARVS
jgi:hypothetical protein